MKPRQRVWFSNLLFVLTTFFFLCACGTQTEEVVDLDEILPTEALTEITHGHPDFRVVLVAEEDANVPVAFGDKFLNVEGVEDEELRQRLANLVLQYLENPNKKEDDRAKREAYEKLPPKEKLADFVERMKSHYPDFAYEWVGLGEGNVKAEYGDNSLVISGVEDDGAKEEIAHGIIRLQKEIDKLSSGEQE